MGQNHGQMAIILTSKAKENLLRLWKSTDQQHHNLAFQMLDGFDLHSEDYQWLWDCYYSVNTNKPHHATLINLSQINPREFLQGRILAVLLENEDIAHSIFKTFFKHSILRMPYVARTSFPSSLYTFPHVIEELIWQDGEIKEIDENIIQLKQLQRLDLRRQPIEIIHPAITDLPFLEEIHLISTSFLPDEFMDRKDIEIYTDAPY